MFQLNLLFRISRGMHFVFSLNLQLLRSVFTIPTTLRSVIKVFQNNHRKYSEKQPCFSITLRENQYFFPLLKIHFKLKRLTFILIYIFRPINDKPNTTTAENPYCCECFCKTTFSDTAALRQQRPCL